MPTILDTCKFDYCTSFNSSTRRHVSIPLLLKYDLLYTHRTGHDIDFSTVKFILHHSQSVQSCSKISANEIQ